MTTAKPASTGRCAAILSGLALAASACSSSENGGALARGEPTEAFADVPVPPADGPKLLALREATPVVDRPGPGAKKLGELRVGSVVARSKERYSTKECDGGWYAVRPRGFVCVGPAATLDLTTARGLPAPPDLTRALPYRYARGRAENLPLYAHVPAVAEQAEAEPELRKIRAREPDKDPLGAAANDVPLDERGVPTGPPVLVPGGDGIENGRRTVMSYFNFAADAQPPSIPASAELASRGLRKGSGIALTGSFMAESSSGQRRFAVTPDGHVVPTDRLRPLLGSAWHGLDVEKIGLPIAFVLKPAVNTFGLQRGKAIKHDDELERRSPIALTGKFRTIDGVRFEETRAGAWLRAQDLIVIVRRHKLPEFAKGTQKWLDVSIANQTLTAYEGSKPIYATLISSGRDMLKDPLTTAATPRGTFKVVTKRVTAAIDNREVQNGFDVTDAPWALEIEPGFSITGNYWSDSMGEAQGFHNIALTPIDAHRIWTWSGPELPEGWHGVVDASGDAATIVNVRP